MRITFGLAAMASLCLLAGCNNGAANNSAAANAAAPVANAPEPVSNEVAPPPAETPAPTNSAAGGEQRSTMLAQCVGTSPGNLPEGTDATVFCGCAVDKVLASNVSQRDAVNQCAREMNITLPSRG